MSEKKIRIGIIFGGRSAEHEVSLQSAKNIIEALDPNRYEPLLIGIDKEGKWHVNDAKEYLLNAENPKLIRLNHSNKELSFIPGRKENQLMLINDSDSLKSLDVIFPIVHGPLAEDGTIQGLLKLANIPFVGPSVLSSATCMDKDFAKRLFEQAGLPICKHFVLRNRDKTNLSYEKLAESLGLPMFVKPANMGSSVGISKVDSKEGFEKGLAEAFLYDHKVVVEGSIKGRELEVAVLGNEDPQASAVGEIIPKDGFYSYDAKYVDAKGAELKVPADLDDEVAEQLKTMAVNAFKIMECRGLARCDFFLTEDGKIYLNEINTLPGFTKISMYPKLWEASGVSYSSLIDKLVQFARDCFDLDSRLKVTVD